MEDASESQQSAHLTGQKLTAEQGMATLKIKASLSPFLASSGALFARNAYALEQAYAKDKSTVSDMDHRSYCIGAVIASATYLESAINELYQEAIDRDPNTFGAHKHLAELMDHFWEKTKVQPVLAKYQIALTLGDKPPFIKGDEPYQSVDALIQLRNALIHYKPEWDTELKVHQKLEERLAKRFAPNPLVAPTQAFFPHRCLGHGCAAWSITTAVEFYYEFMNRLGLPARQIHNPAGLAVQ